MSSDLLAQLQSAKNDEEREWIVLQFSLSNLEIVVRKAVWAAAVSHWFDEAFLGAILDTPTYSSSDHFHNLISLSFIEPFPGRGYDVHERTRILLLKRLWDEDHDQYRLLSQRAADYCSTQDQADTAWRIETIYHLLVAHPDKGADELRSTGWEWHDSPNYAYNKVEALVRAAREHADAGRLSKRGLSWAVFWEAQLDSVHSRFRSAKARYMQIQDVSDYDPDLAAIAAFRLGAVHGMLSEKIEARTCYEAALSLYRKLGSKVGEANCIRALGDVHIQLSENIEARARYEEALVDYGRALEVDSNDAHTFYNRGNTYMSLRDYSAALTDFSHALELNPHFAEAYNNRGNIYAELQDYSAALVDFSRALELSPKSALVFYNRGNIYQSLQDYPAALADFSHALELDPNFAEAYNNRGNIFVDLQNYSAALADFSHALELNSQSGQIFYNRGNVHQIMQDYSAALADYQRALELEPKLAQAFYGRGNMYQALQDYPAAIDDYQRAIGFYEQSVAIYREIGDHRRECRTLGSLGDVYRALGDARRAIELYELELAGVREVGDRLGEASVLDDLSAAYNDLGEIQQAAIYNQQSLTITRELGDRWLKRRLGGSLSRHSQHYYSSQFKWLS
jgi:tetratricopeptide (TPR) repeat protein